MMFLEWKTAAKAEKKVQNKNKTVSRKHFYYHDIYSASFYKFVSKTSFYEKHALYPWI
jgi:hypothetical protein